MTPAAEDSIDEEVSGFEWVTNLSASGHAGRYASFVNREVVMIGDTLHEVVAAARRKYPGQTPFAVHIPQPISYVV